MIGVNRRRVGSKSEIDWSNTYFTFQALDSGWFKNANRAMEYSLDKGKTWTTLAANTNSPTVSKGKYIMWRCTLNQGEQVGSFQGQKQFDVMGNAMSLIFGDNFQGKDDLTGYNSVLYKLFNDYTGVVSAENMYLPAMTLSEGCYKQMFERCSSLTTPPKLPATTLANSCYMNMFAECTRLTSTPELPATTLAPYCYQSMFYRLRLSTPPALPATTLAEGCYSTMFQQAWITTAPSLPANKMEKNCYSRMFRESHVTQAILPAMELAENCYLYMFEGCTSLITAPALPATTLAKECYYGMFKRCTNLVNAPVLPTTTMAQSAYGEMFRNCTSLITAPVLPATTLAFFCYQYMFDGCTSLVNAPELPAQVMQYRCYNSMFSGCTNLNYIKAMFTTEPGTNYTNNWVDGVSATGTFVKNSAATWNVSGVNGIPEGWTIQTASE